MIDEERILRNENRRIKSLREYYRENFMNGGSDEAFLLWLETRIAEIYGDAEDKEQSEVLG